MAEETINRIQLKASLLDAITFMKFGRHMAPNAAACKARICKQAGQSPRISTLNYIRLIGLIYEDNKLQQEFFDVVNKYGIADKVYQD
jgi:hypothetical protein